MAKATKKDKGYTLTLELTQGEAEMLRALTGSVGGTGEARDAVNSVWGELGKAGVQEHDLFTDSIWVKGGTGWTNNG